MYDDVSKFSPLYKPQPPISYHHDQLWAGTPPDFLQRLYNEFDYRVDDVWLSTYPRSGTAWSYEVLYALLYEGDITALKQAQSEGSILKFLPLELGIGSTDAISERLNTWQTLPSRRVIPAHLSYRL